MFIALTKIAKLRSKLVGSRIVLNCETIFIVKRFLPWLERRTFFTMSNKQSRTSLRNYLVETYRKISIAYYISISSSPLAPLNFVVSVFLDQ